MPGLFLTLLAVVTLRLAALLGLFLMAALCAGLGFWLAGHDRVILGFLCVVLSHLATFGFAGLVFGGQK